jgi:lipopolysaccharide transport system ATP-binding protein
MPHPVIKVENLSKLYRLGLVGTGTMAHDLNRWWKMNILGKSDPYAKIGETNDRSHKGISDFVWALKDINFEVHQGEVLGIIGRNGAGKSTLLKILSKVTTPTTGNIKIQGRIASLLEVGTGFHPELTGRENVYMNGTIMGMKKREIDAKFDEIVDFAGVERYIDTPVKRYSSGMMVRLGFAVAAHLEPEILIIDEVLAVGDAEFQRKAMGKMQNVTAYDGRTVLFVSHNMAAVKSLCKSAILLQNGKTYFEGTQLEVINKYQNLIQSKTSYVAEGDISGWEGNENIRIKYFIVKPLKGDVLSISSGFTFEVFFYNYKSGINLDVTFELSTADEIVVFHHGTLITTNNDSQTGFYKVKGTLPSDFLNAGSYKFKVIFGENQRYVLFIVSEFVSFEVLNEGIGSNNSLLPGVIRANIPYEVIFSENL